jgi:rubrerythrin
MRGMIFPGLADLREVLGQKDHNPVLLLVRAAMGVETNSILFYEQMKALLGEEETKDALSKIVREEQGHLIKLKSMRLELDPYYSTLRYGRWF